MDSGKEDSHGDVSGETSTSQSPQSRRSAERDIIAICGKQQKPPRVGYEYQVEIPPFVVESEPSRLMKRLSDDGIMVNVVDSFLEALPVPIMWISNGMDRRHDANGSLDSTNTISIKKSSSKEDSKIKVKSEDKVSFAAPGCLDSCWTDLEKEAFLLGLYIFGKNLVNVKRFVESKPMADILSFYYGEFYRSAAHRRWSGSWNKDRRSRRCIQGPKMFKTWRQQKFLSCLLPCIPEKWHSTLVEVSKSFEAGSVSLEEYVSSLKAIVGLAVLIEVFGIGKGKQDLTGLVTDPARNNQQAISHPDIPVGKGWSALTLGEIVGFLTEDYRLSKARSNDLFWEAVWPRLLARGWQSKQPKNHTGTSSKSPLVFIVPGVKKFSLRKFVKGDLYFDSVADVLNKVASDPSLLELEDETGKSNIGNQENKWGKKKTKLDNNVDIDHKRCSYLQPQFVESNFDLMKFTVIDTSMGGGEDSFPVRELRSLPDETTHISSPESLPVHNENGFKDPVNEKGAANMPLNYIKGTNTSRSSDGITDREACSESLKFIYSGSKEEMQFASPVHAEVTLHNGMDQSTCNPDMHSKKPIKFHFSRRKKPSQSNYMSPVIKCPILTTCSEVKAICSKDIYSSTHGLKEGGHHLHLGSSNASENLVSVVTQSQGEICSSSSGKASPDENCIGNSISQNEKHPPLVAIDLNLPHVLSDLETDDPFIREVDTTQCDSSSKDSCSPPSSDVAGAEQQPPVLVVRRQGSRKRPLTAKALESLVCGFLTTQKKPRYSMQS
ncbi:hypothetical protein MKW98_023539 [Papaver atlanticum]|uniref:SANT domain-containing protein n=1 Tax=Papaver atlanticum TaxID=357466 RepID=A0AAD4XMU8_9MAGN|nr:hypothetical protein MKW98_023539 [Papaver atlanticum]